MDTYFVSVAATRTNFLGDSETIAKTIRVRATDPIEAGEYALDTTIGGSRWMFSSARAVVSSISSGEEVARVETTYPKAFGVRRDTTRSMWAAT